MGEIRINRIYEVDSKWNAVRILVDRLWPRGISKENANLDAWWKEIAPTNELRKWFGHAPEKFNSFRDQYFSELEANPKATKYKNQMLTWLKEQDVELVFGAKDPERNNAAVLRDWILGGCGDGGTKEGRTKEGGTEEDSTKEGGATHGCGWEFGSEKMKHYHDTRWCKPLHEDQELFAMLILEGAQAGLSWASIINREENYRIAFDQFDPKVVAGYGQEKVEELMQNAGIIRNRRKIESATSNAKAFLRIQEEFGSFDRYIWGFTDGKVIDHHLQDVSEMPATSELSIQVSKDLKKRGFHFVGPTIIYSYLQGIGVYNDHLVDCEYR